MKPLKLEFKGINSFSEHTIIDFETLTKNGIFGIFGDTGSGKSTVLDCINFALYGNVERSKEKSDIINYRCNQAEVKFVFDILNEGKRKKYTVERILKNDKSGTHKASLYEDDGERELCIADKASSVEKKIVEILGIEDEDFRKCIALPQGEFSQFVKSAPRERLALIERLFSLSRYGDRLKEKLSMRQNAIESEYQNISGRLSGYEEVTPEALDMAETQVTAGQKRLDELSSSAKSAAEKYDRIRGLNTKRAELKQTIDNLEKLKAEKPLMEQLRKGLSALPACREVVKTSEAVGEKGAEAEKLKSDIVVIEEKLKRETASVALLEQKLKDGGFEEKILACAELAASYQTAQGKPEKLKNILIELDKRRAEYRAKEAECAKLLKEKAEAEASVADAEKSLETVLEKDLDFLVNVEFKGAVLKDEYVKNLDYFARLHSGICAFEDDSPLYSYVSAEADKKIAEYKERICAVKDFSIEAVAQKLKDFKQSDKEREIKQKSLNDKKEELRKLASACEIKQTELFALKKDGAELRARADELEAELKKIFGEKCSDFAAAVAKNDRESVRLKEEKQSLSERLESAKNAERELGVSLERLKILHSSATAEAQNLLKKLNALIAEGGLESVESCKKQVDEFSAFPDAEKTLSEYDGKIMSLSERRKDLEKTEGIDGVSDEITAAAEAEKAETENAVKELTGTLAVLKSARDNMKRRLDEKNAILKDFASVEKRRNLLAQLKEVTKGNKFLEYIADEYLVDISLLASSTLLKLTDGRYFLTYKDNNFFVGDNFNCGNLRGVNTLSGGETFLVSLSLALALSQTICAKSLKSIEFFFLDEGFGTLDSTLVDTVMNALEKLKSSHFTIGVISHVEELKYRISSKITVNKATESHGSTVSVSC